mmetsp:Transcript_20120/g.54843  ORF Transcript_20120/g.54843 Transcript_20120/m.54843 type:complete len:304 (-) Transcript_20120:209-1120(-)
MAEAAETVPTAAQEEEHELSRKERRAQKDQARIEELKPLVEKLGAAGADEQLDAVRELRTLMHGAQPPSIDTVVHAGLVPRLLELGKKNDNHDIQFEALWVLSDLTAGTDKQTHEIVESGAIDIFEHLLLSPSASAREQALTILANIAGASVDLRDKVMASGVVKDVLKMLHVGMATEHQTYYDETTKVWKLRAGEPEQPVSVTRKAATCVSRLCQGEPQPALGEAAKPLLMALVTLIMETDEEILVQTCTALSTLKYGQFEHDLMVKDGVDTRLGDLASTASEEVQALAKSAAEKIAAGKSG